MVLLSLKGDPKTNTWNAKIHLRRVTKVEGEGPTPEVAMAKLLEAIQDHGMALELRAFLASFFEPYIELLAKEHGIPLKGSQLAVVHGGKVHESK